MSPRFNRFAPQNVTVTVALVAISVAALCTPGTLYAQTARFLGQVTDAQGAVVPHVPVHITNLDTGTVTNTESSDSGEYSAQFLTAGNYRITVEAPGFDPYTHDLNVQVGQAVSFDVQLTVGATKPEEVTVQESSEATAINIQNSEVTTTVTGKEVQALQLNGRNPTQLIALAPGVSNQTSQDEARVGLAGSVSYSINGGRTEYNTFLVDGSDVLNVGINGSHTALIVTPSVDALQEIKVLTSNYSAQYPSSGSGTTIFTTKSGGDSYHGSLYEFNRNEAFNAKGYFDIGTHAPLYRRNDFGGTIGGPLSIPKLYDAKGKTHFFFSEEARLEKDPYAYRRGVPSLAERNGDFSDVCPAVATGANATFSRAQYPDCPDSGLGSDFYGAVPATFLSNQITYPGQSSNYVLNQNAVAILNTGIIPLPTATSGCNSTGSSCYNAEVSLPTYWREELFRIDQTINPSWQASFRYIHDEWDETTPVPQYAYTQNSFPTIQNRFYGPGRSLVARVTGAFSPTFLNEFVLSYTDSYITLADVAPVGVSLARPATLDGACGGAGQQCPMTEIFENQGRGLNGVPKLPGISVAGNNGEYGGFGFASDPGYTPWEHSNPTYSIADNLTKTIGRHNLQFGANLVIYQRNQVNGPIGAATGDTQGLLTFSNLRNTGSTGNAFADFLYTNLSTSTPGGTGAISSFQQDSAQSRYRQRYRVGEPYFQDDWKVSPRLTLNAGLRLSLFGNYYEANNQAYNWEASAFSASTASTLSAAGPYGNLQNVADGTPITLNPANPSAGLDPRVLNGIVQCGSGSRPRSCASSHLLNPSPRVGLAWDPLGDGKTSIRAGYGVFFEHGTADEANTGSLEGASPIVLDMTEVDPDGWSTIGVAPSGSPGAGSTYAFPLNVTAIPVKQVWPYVQQWSGSIERQLPDGDLLNLTYVGSKGTHLTAEREINQLAPSPSNPFGLHEPLLTKGANPAVGGNLGFGTGGGDCYQFHNSFTLLNGTQVDASNPIYSNLLAACYTADGGLSPNALRTFAPGLGDIYSLENVADSNYNAFQAQIRRIKAPLTLDIAYTYSHSFDDASDRSDATFVNSFNLRSNYSSSGFDQRHLLHVSYIYDLSLLKFFDTILHFDDADPDNQAANYPGHTYDPAAFGSSKIAKFALDGWQLSGLTLFETGIPFTVVNNGSATGFSVLDNAGVANGVGSGSYPDLSGISPHTMRPAGGSNSKSFGPLLLNPGAFVAPRGLTFGNAGRNVLNNPHRTNFDAALLKHFPVGEHVQAEFRAESFNLFNHTQFRIYDPALGNQAQNEVSCYGGPAAYFSAGGGDGTDCLTGNSFLHPVDAHRPRTIQFALKLAF